MLICERSTERAGRAQARTISTCWGKVQRSGSVRKNGDDSLAARRGGDLAIRSEAGTCSARPRLCGLDWLHLHDRPLSSFRHIHRHRRRLLGGRLVGLCRLTDLDLPHRRRRPRRQRHIHFENAVRECGSDVFRFHTLGQRHRAIEAAVVPLGAEHVVLLLLLLPVRSPERTRYPSATSTVTSSFLTPGKSTLVTSRLSFSNTSTFGAHVAGSGSSMARSVGQPSVGQNGASKARSSSAVICRSNTNGSRGSRVGASVTFFLSVIEHLLRDHHCLNDEVAA